MLRHWIWILGAIVVGAVAAAAVTGLERLVLMAWPALDPAGSAPPELGRVLALLAVIYAFVGWTIGLSVLGLPLALSLRRIGLDGYVSAMLAGAIGGAVCLMIILVVMQGTRAMDVIAVYALMMLPPGAVAGAVVRHLAYRRSSLARS